MQVKSAASATAKAHKLNTAPGVMELNTVPGVMELNTVPGVMFKF